MEATAQTPPPGLDLVTAHPSRSYTSRCGSWSDIPIDTLIGQREIGQRKPTLNRGGGDEMCVSSSRQETPSRSQTALKNEHNQAEKSIGAI